MTVKVPDDHFDKQFPQTPEGRVQLARHSAYLYNSLQEQTERYLNSLEEIVEALKVIPAVKLTVDIKDILRAEE